MKYECKILADSISPALHRVTTFQVTFPRIILAEVNTHKMVVKNSASSRAIPVEKMMARIQDDPFIPVYWGKNQKGMVAEEELSIDTQEAAEKAWLRGRDAALSFAKELLALGIHKQITNRILEPWLAHTAILTATDWANFLNLRTQGNAQPEIRVVAKMMQEAYGDSIPLALKEGEWHLPLVRGVDEDQLLDFMVLDRVKVSAGRTARTSYLTHDGKRDPQADIDLATRLREDWHMSPWEHPCRAMNQHELEIFSQKKYEWRDEGWTPTGEVSHYLGPFNGWVQARKMIPGEAVFEPRA